MQTSTWWSSSRKPVRMHLQQCCNCAVYLWNDRNHCQKQVVQKYRSLGITLLCFTSLCYTSAHGYAQVHTNIYIYIYISAGPCLSGAYGCGDREVVCCLAVAVLQLQSVVCWLWAPETDLITFQPCPPQDSWPCPDPAKSNGLNCNIT